MAKLYKIAVIGLLLKNNQVEKHGTLVTADQLPRSVEELLNENYITEATKEEIDAKVKTEAKTEVKGESGEDAEAERLKQAQIDAEKAKQDEADAEAERLKQAKIDADLTGKDEVEDETKVDAKKPNPIANLKK